MIRTHQKKNSTETHSGRTRSKGIETTDAIKQRQKKGRSRAAQNMAKRGFNTDGTRKNTRKKRMKEVNKHRFNGRY